MDNEENLPGDETIEKPKENGLADRIADASQRARAESMSVNAEFAAIEEDPEELGQGTYPNR